MLQELPLVPPLVLRLQKHLSCVQKQLPGDAHLANLITATVMQYLRSSFSFSSKPMRGKDQQATHHNTLVKHQLTS